MVKRKQKKLEAYIWYNANIVQKYIGTLKKK